MSASGDAPVTDAAVVWRSRALRLALAAFPLWCTVSLLIFNAPWRFRLLVTGLFGLTAFAPHAGLLVLAVIVPLGHLIQVGLHLQPFRFTEAAVLAFFAGWLVKGRADRDGPRVPGTVAWSLAAIIGASVVAQMLRAAFLPGELMDSLQVIYQAYFLVPERVGFGAAALLLEGLGLMAATTNVFRMRPRLANTLPIAMISTAIVAAASGGLLSRGIAFPQILEEHARVVVRTSAHVGDPNAAASYFGMMLFVALGMAARRTWRSRGLWLLAAATQIGGLLLAASRTGVAVVVLVLSLGVVSALTSGWRPRTRKLALSGMLALAVAGGLARAWTLRADPGTGFRRQFFATSLRMIADRPLTGIGVGRYYDASALFLPAETTWTYPLQNAHNNFLQIAAETGLVGFALLAMGIGTIVWRAAHAIGRSPGDMRLLGCTLGVAAMLMTWLTGHPMLLPEVAYPFWMLLGLTAGLAGSVLIEAGELSRQPELFASGRARRVAISLVGLVALGIIESERRPLQPSASEAVTGLESWETDGAGARFRWTHQYASVFVPFNATRVYIPVRLPVNVPQLLPMPVEVQVDGVPRGQTMVGTDWAILNLELPRGDPLVGFKRIDLRLPRTWQPAVYVPGSGDLRRIGVQVGEIKEFYEY